MAFDNIDKSIKTDGQLKVNINSFLRYCYEVEPDRRFQEDRASVIEFANSNHIPRWRRRQWQYIHFMFECWESVLSMSEEECLFHSLAKAASRQRELFLDSAYQNLNQMNYTSIDRFSSAIHFEETVLGLLWAEFNLNPDVPWRATNRSEQETERLKLLQRWFRTLRACRFPWKKNGTTLEDNAEKVYNAIKECLSRGEVSSSSVLNRLVGWLNRPQTFFPWSFGHILYAVKESITSKPEVDNVQIAGGFLVALKEAVIQWNEFVEKIPGNHDVLFIDFYLLQNGYGERHGILALYNIVYPFLFEQGISSPSEDNRSLFRAFNEFEFTQLKTQLISAFTTDLPRNAWAWPNYLRNKLVESRWIRLYFEIPSLEPQALREMHSPEESLREELERYDLEVPKWQEVRFEHYSTVFLSDTDLNPQRPHYSIYRFPFEAAFDTESFKRLLVDRMDIKYGTGKRLKFTETEFTILTKAFRYLQRRFSNNQDVVKSLLSGEEAITFAYHATLDQDMRQQMAAVVDRLWGTSLLHELKNQLELVMGSAYRLRKYIDQQKLDSADKELKESFTPAISSLSKRITNWRSQLMVEDVEAELFLAKDIGNNFSELVPTLALHHGIEVHFNFFWDTILPDGIKVPGQPLQLALTTIIENGIEAKKSTGAMNVSFSIAFRKHGRMLQITILNDGPDLPPNIDKIISGELSFHSTKGLARGSGLFLNSRVLASVGGTLKAKPIIPTRNDLPGFQILIPYKEPEEGAL